VISDLSDIRIGPSHALLPWSPEARIEPWRVENPRGKNSAGAAQALPVLDQADGPIIPYRVIGRDDFLASSSNSLWGNIAHGAEICTTIVPTNSEGSSFHAVMQRECSFWNSVIRPASTLTRAAGVIAGVPTITPKKQPDWYILQHEQIHFAINEVAARTLTRQAERLAVAEAEARASLLSRLYRRTLENAAVRQREFDRATSGKFDPRNLEKWTRVLETQMKQLCGTEPTCQVRIPD